MSSQQTTVTIGNRKLRFLPLTWQQLEDTQKDVDTITAMGNKNSFFTAAEREAMFHLVFVSLQRSEPDITAEWLKSNMDLSNVNGLLAAVFTLNAFNPDKVEEGQQQGEAQAAASES